MEFNTEKYFVMKAISKLQKRAKVIQRPHAFNSCHWCLKVNLSVLWLGRQVLTNISVDG
jgi:hypothetical protein